MEKLLEKLGLNADATEEEIVAKLEALQKEKTQLESEKSKLESTNKELSASVEGLKATNETLKESYKSLVENQSQQEDVDKPKDILIELSEDK